jgi:hypothetical protein
MHFLIVVVLVWGYCNLFGPKQLENPGLNAYRAPTGVVVHPLISVELVPEAEGGNGTETVGHSLKDRRAESAMAFSDARGSQRRSEGRRTKLAHLGKPRPGSREVVMTFSGR